MPKLIALVLCERVDPEPDGVSYDLEGTTLVNIFRYVAAPEFPAKIVGRAYICLTAEPGHMTASLVIAQTGGAPYGGATIQTEIQKAGVSNTSCLLTRPCPL